MPHLSNGPGIFKTTASLAWDCHLGFTLNLTTIALGKSFPSTPLLKQRCWLNCALNTLPGPVCLRCDDNDTPKLKPNGALWAAAAVLSQHHLRRANGCNCSVLQLILFLVNLLIFD